MSTRNVVPRADGEGSLGTLLKNWLSGFFKWIKIDSYIDFNKDEDSPSWQEGRIFYDKIEHTLAIYNEVSGITHNLGQEHLIRVKNETGTTIENGKVVKIVGSNGTQCPTVNLALADTESNATVLGLTTCEILDGYYGYVCVCGKVHEINTSMFLSGEVVYLSSTMAGELTTVKPSIVTIVGRIIKTHLTEGIIYVFPKELGTISADMLKTIYDINDNSIVDKAENVDDGTSGGIHASTAEEVRDAVDKKHTQNTDTILDEGGVNEVSASDITKKSGSLTQLTTRNHSDLQNKNTETDIKHITDNQKNALDNANSPSTLNPIATKEDIKYYYAESLEESNTTSLYPTYINKLTLNIIPIAGNYILEWNFSIANSVANKGSWIKVHNGTTVYLESQMNALFARASSGWLPIAGFIKLTGLTAINQNYYIDFCIGNNTVYIKNAKLLLRRVV